MQSAWRLLGAAALMTVCLGALSGAARAEASVSGNVALTTDYVFRGISQTDDDMAIQGGFDYTDSELGGLPVYVGVWGSSLDFGSTVDSGIEVDVYAGVRPVFGPVTMDFGVIGYFYPGSDIDDLDYVEFKAGLSGKPAEPLTLGATAYYSPEFTLNGGHSLYGEVNAAYAFNEFFSLSAAVGNQSVEADGYFVGPGTDTDNYSTWNVGGTASKYGFSLDLRYYDTNENIVNFDGTVVSDERVVVTLKRAL
jgi:uncharacterized protein (TIGR02001 family)